MEKFGPVILIEVVLVFGGVLLFAWWQIHDLRKKRDQKKALNQSHHSARLRLIAYVKT